MQPPASCVLSELPQPLASKTVLFAFISATQNPLFTRLWLEHYRDLRVQLTRSKVVVDEGGAAAEQVRETVAIVEEQGVHVELVAKYTSSLKQNEANRFLASLPRDNYLIYPDADELFD